VIVATWALCADTQEEAERLATSSRMALSLLRTTGKTMPVPTVETAMRYLEEPAGSLPIARRRRMTIGTKETVRDGLEAIAGDYGAEEVMVVTITHSHEARKRSYELVAEAFDLQPPR
jgi:alkanesulfonate monooxygenase SsuD/methylene tetrahydromethanopterin reductase-like flavin-dependent oxidoreductase (luciferase family)